MDIHVYAWCNGTYGAEAERLARLFAVGKSATEMVIEDRDPF